MQTVVGRREIGDAVMIQVELVEVAEDGNLYPCPGDNNLTLRRGRQRQEACLPPAALAARE
jgi:hypothetical protein